MFNRIEFSIIAPDSVPVECRRSLERYLFNVFGGWSAYRGCGSGDGPYDSEIEGHTRYVSSAPATMGPDTLSLHFEAMVHALKVDGGQAVVYASVSGCAGLF